MYGINSYLLESQSVNNLTTDPDFFRIRRNSRHPLNCDYIINWGAKHLPSNLIQGKQYIWANSPEVTKLLSNKLLLAVYVNQDEGCKSDFIQMTYDGDVALQWLRDGCSVVCRTLVTASKGRGAYVVDPITEDAESLLVRSADGAIVKLWSVYFKKRSEYRYHAGLLRDGEFYTIAVQEKRKRYSYEGDTRLRNSEGYVFRAKSLIDVPHAVANCVERVMRNIAEDYPEFAFAGIDVAYNETYDKARIIELNTAPGLGVSDSQNYRTFFRKYFSE